MSMVELENVTKSFGGLRAVDGLSIGFERGKVTCIVGPNAAGKTTLFSIICGFLRPDRGRVIYRGEDITGFAPWQIARKGISRLYQGGRVYGRLSVLDNVMAAFKGQVGESALMSVVARWRVADEERRLKREALDLLEEVGLNGEAPSLAGELSFGQQKLLALTRIIASKSDVILLDEPTAGVNPGLLTGGLPDEARERSGPRAQAGIFLNLIRKLADDGKTVIVIEHNVRVVHAIADWVYFMEQGRLTASGTPDAVLGSSGVRDSYIET